MLYGFTIAWLLLFSEPAVQAQGIGITAHNHIAMQVADIEASKQFCAHILGLKSVPVLNDLKAIRAWFHQVSEQHRIHLPAGRMQPVVNDKDGSHFACSLPILQQRSVFSNCKKYYAQMRFDGVRQLYSAAPDGYLIELNQQK